MPNLALKDFEILSEQEQQEALALLDRYKRIENKKFAKKTLLNLSKVSGPIL
jgi:hypothetical protein